MMAASPAPLAGSCHCGAVRIELPRRPRSLTACNGSIRRRYGTLWGYYKADDVRLLHEPGAIASYAGGRKALGFVRCAGCGCLVCWPRTLPGKTNCTDVNMRNFEPELLGALRLRRLDGADTWEYLD